MYKPTFFAFIFLAVASQSAVVLAEKANQHQTQKISVLDEQGKPIKGVSLLLSGVGCTGNPTSTQSKSRMKEFGSSRFSLVLGDKSKVYTTDQFGRATLVFPGYTDCGQITDMWVEIDHEFFVKRSQKVVFKDSTVVLTLERGCRVTASAIDANTKERITGNLYALTNGRWTSTGGRRTLVDWNQGEQGKLISPLLGTETTSFRLVHIVGGKAVRFSKLVEIVPDGKRELLFKNLEMVKAVTVKGKLVGEILGPLRNSSISACVVSLGKADRVSKKGPHSWCWKSSTHIKQDGTFVLEGIPPGSTLQVFAAGLGWSNKPLSVEELRDHFPKAVDYENWIMPQLAHIGYGDSDIEVAVQPLGKATINVVDSAQQPISDARVSVRPQQTFLYSGHSIYFGYRSSSTKDLNELRDPLVKFLRGREFRSTSFYSECSSSALKTNDAGSVTTCSIPAGKTRINVRCPGYQSLNGETRTFVQETIKTAETIEVTVQLKPAEQ